MGAQQGVAMDFFGQTVSASPNYHLIGLIFMNWDSKSNLFQERRDAFPLWAEQETDLVHTGRWSSVAGWLAGRPGDEQ